MPRKTNTSPNLQANREEPFPSNPTRPTRIGLYMTNPKLNSWHYAGFWAKYAAAIFLDLIQEVQGPFALENDDMYFDTGWIISMRGTQPYCTIKELLKYQPTHNEEDWKVPQNMIDTYRILRNQDQNDIPKPFKPTKENTGPATIQIGDKKSELKLPTEGMISITQLAAEQGISPSVARRALRAHKINKPYEWPESDLARIVKIIKTA